ncbi:MAG: hypothetical protein M3140_09985 [Actinomycetota bacterium]|nr:hypothetical protein [Actinomycetota bacterium]
MSPRNRKARPVAPPWPTWRAGESAEETERRRLAAVELEDRRYQWETLAAGLPPNVEVRLRCVACERILDRASVGPVGIRLDNSNEYGEGRGGWLAYRCPCGRRFHPRLPQLTAAFVVAARSGRDLYLGVADFGLRRAQR